MVAVVSEPATLSKISMDALGLARTGQRTHYKVPRSQANSSLESSFWSEFLTSEAPTLGRSDPLAWNLNNSERLPLWTQVLDSQYHHGQYLKVY